MGTTDSDAPTLHAPAAARTDEGLGGELTLPSLGTQPTVGAAGARVATPRMLQRGDTLGRYVVLEMLGRGGMGVVYAAYDPELDRRVAVKLVRSLPSASTRGSEGHGRLLREAQALAKLTHPNVVGVYDVGTFDQSVFVAMEFIEGETAAAWIERRHAERPPTWKEVLEIFVPAGRGLRAAHEAGIVHRDFKPDNVMVATTGRVVVLDFGLARASGVGAESSPVDAVDTGPSLTRSATIEQDLTATGSLMGTPAYMSPEQFSTTNIDDKSDQFSYCVSLYHALYGRRPFAGETLPELSHAVLQGEIEADPRDRRVPAWLRRVVVRGLARDPAQRHASMAALLQALARDPARRRNRWLLALGGVAALGAASWAATRPPPEAASCAHVDEAMAQVWGPSQRADVEQAFGRDAKAYSEAALDKVTTSLDDYAEQWLSLRRAACEASRQTGTQASVDAGLQVACLDRRLGRVDALVRLLQQADQTMVAQAPRAVALLPDPTVCEDADGYRLAAPVPDDPAQQERVESLRMRSAEAYVQISMGKLDEAGTRAQALLQEARTLDFPPVLGEQLLLQASIDVRKGDFAAALPNFEQALFIARSHGVSRLEADALSPLVFLHTTFTDELALAEWLIRDLDAVAQRLGDPLDARARTLVDRARLAVRREQREQAAELYAEAVALYDEAGVQDFNLIVAFEGLAGTYADLERHDDAAKVLQRAEVLAAEVLGAQHPDRGNLLVLAARVEAARGNDEGSLALLRDALRIYEGSAADHPNLFAVRNGLGLELEALGRVPEAIEEYRRGIALAEKAYGEGTRPAMRIQTNLANALRRAGRAAEAVTIHEEIARTHTHLDVPLVDRVHVLENLADDLRMLERYDDAAQRYREALALRKTSEDSWTDDTEGVYAELGLGLIELLRGEPRAAQSIFESILQRARSQPEPSDILTKTLASVRLGLAMALEAQTPGSEQAQTLAQQAATVWARRPIEHAQHLEALRAWQGDGQPRMLNY